MNAEHGSSTHRPALEETLARVLSAPGIATVAYVDGHGARPQSEEGATQRAVIARLEELGAPESDIAAIRAALPRQDGTPSPSARYLLARDGWIEIDRTFPGARLGSERVAYGPVPQVVPLLRHLARSIGYLVVETGREGADVRFGHADRHAPEQTQEVEGRPDSLTKVQAGGWSHARYQRSAEEVWKHNQSEVAQAVDRLVEERRPAFIVLAGDVRARQVLRDRLSEAALKLVVEHDAHTRAEGSDEAGLAATVTELAEQHVNDAVAAAVDRARADDGSSGAEGVEAVVEALQQARVDTLVLDARLTEDPRTVCALDAQPWVAVGSGEGLEAKPLSDVPLAEGLARAAILTGARVLIREEEFAAPDEPRTDATAAEPLASLRWAEAS